MQDTDITMRVQRISRGERRLDDIDRIFLHLRSLDYTGGCVREVGDFISHRDKREWGVVTGRAKDILASFRHWLLTVNGVMPPFEDIAKAAEATLRVATDAQLKDGLGLSRKKTKAGLKHALQAAKNGVPYKGREEAILNYLGGKFIWNTAFSDVKLFDRLVQMLKAERLLSTSDTSTFSSAREFVILHVIATMHGTSMVMDVGDPVKLRATFAQGTAFLGIKAEFGVVSLAKPVSRACSSSTLVSARKSMRPRTACSRNMGGLIARGRSRRKTCGDAIASHIK